MKKFFYKESFVVGSDQKEQSISKEIPLWQGYKKSMIAGGPSKLARVLQMGQIVRASAEEILLQDYKENYKEKVMKKLMY